MEECFLAHFFISKTKNSSSANLNTAITKGSYVAVLSHSMTLRDSMDLEVVGSVQIIESLKVWIQKGYF